MRVPAIQGWLGAGVEVVRTMPNTPSRVRRGVTGMFAPASTSARARERADRVMQAVGSVCWVDSEDAFDALTSHRPYRRAVSADEALFEITRHAGTQFDPAVVAALARTRTIAA